MSWDLEMHGYARFCFFGWVLNSAMGPAKMQTQNNLHANARFSVCLDCT